MKKTFEFKSEDDKFLIVNNSPNEKRTPFIIDKQEMQFDSNAFYQYVFSDFTSPMEIEIKNMSNANDKLAQRTYDIISEIIEKVTKELNKT